MTNYFDKLFIFPANLMLCAKTTVVRKKPRKFLKKIPLNEIKINGYLAFLPNFPDLGPQNDLKSDPKVTISDHMDPSALVQNTYSCKKICFCENNRTVQAKFEVFAKNETVQAQIYVFLEIVDLPSKN